MTIIITPTTRCQIFYWYAEAGRNHTDSQAWEASWTTELLRSDTLAPLVSKVLARLESKLREKAAIPDIQFGFRDKRGTIEQVHRWFNAFIQHSRHENTLPSSVCPTPSAESRAKDLSRNWRRQFLPSVLEVLPSYLKDRHLYVKHEGERTRIQPFLFGYVRQLTESCRPSHPYDDIPKALNINVRTTRCALLSLRSSLCHAKPTRLQVEN